MFSYLQIRALLYAYQREEIQLQKDYEQSRDQLVEFIESAQKECDKSVLDPLGELNDAIKSADNVRNAPVLIVHITITYQLHEP